MTPGGSGHGFAAGPQNLRSPIHPKNRCFQLIFFDISVRLFARHVEDRAGCAHELTIYRAHNVSADGGCGRVVTFPRVGILEKKPSSTTMIRLFVRALPGLTAVTAMKPTANT
jgi:hypothetical protein